MALVPLKGLSPGPLATLKPLGRSLPRVTPPADLSHKVGRGVLLESGPWDSGPGRLTPHPRNLVGGGGAPVESRLRPLPKADSTQGRTLSVPLVVVALPPSTHWATARAGYHPHTPEPLIVPPLSVGKGPCLLSTRWAPARAGYHPHTPEPLIVPPLSVGKGPVREGVLSFRPFCLAAAWVVFYPRTPEPLLVPPLA